MSQKPIIQGRNFIETLILSMTQYELTNPGLETQELITRKLEEELCALSYSTPFIKNFYHETIKKLLTELYPDLPLPSFKSCFAFDDVLEWMNKHMDIILKEKSELITLRDAEKQVRQRCIHVVRTAIKATFYKAALVSVKP